MIQPNREVAKSWLASLTIAAIVGCGGPYEQRLDNRASTNHDVAPMRDHMNIEVTARTYLVAGNNEALGYGLYSYLLLTEPRDDADRQRCLAAIKSYHLQFRTVKETIQYSSPDRHRINVFYLPIKLLPESEEPPGSETSDASLNMIEQQDRDAEWALENYDFGRAASFILRTNLGSEEGPFIVSSLIPLSYGKPDAILRQNLSEVPPRVMEGWFREFDKTVRDDREWNEEAVEQAVLELRTFLSQAADLLPEVKGELVGWITFIKGNLGSTG